MKFAKKQFSRIASKLDIVSNFANIFSKNNSYFSVLLPFFQLDLPTLTARLLLSVTPLVKIISFSLALMSRATCFRATSTASSASPIALDGWHWHTYPSRTRDASSSAGSSDRGPRRTTQPTAAASDPGAK